MSSCFNGEWHARQLGSIVMTLALLTCGAAQAQSVDNQPFPEGVSTRTYNGTTPLRIRHSTESFGQEASETALGARGAVDLAGAVGFVDGQFRISNESRFGTNLGGGVRWYADDILTGAPRILGISGWYDGQETIIRNYFNQGGVSFESLGEFVDLRLNANIPFEDQKLGDRTIVTGDLNFLGNSLSQATLTPGDVSLRVVDFEVATRVLDLNAWIYGGGYQMDGNGVSEFGPKGGVRGYITNDLLVDVGVTDDDVFGTNTVFQVTWTPGRTGAGPTSWIHTLADRMREPVYRNAYIATQQTQIEGSLALTDAAGDEIRIVHVDSNAAPGGNGSFEAPLNSLSTIQGNSQTGDIILVHANSEFTGQTAVIRDEQRFLGEGGGNTHTIVTTEIGSVTIPETFAGALNADRPEINNGGAVNSVLLTQSTADASAFTAMEVSNFDFFGGQSAITTASGIGAVNINRLAIDGTASHAIALTPITETLTSGQRLRFSPQISDITLTNVAGDGIRLNGGADPAASVAIVEDIDITNVTSTNAGNVVAGAGIRLINTRRATTINGYDWNGGVGGVGGQGGEGALSIEGARAQGNITLSGDNLLTGGRTNAVDTAGYAIQILDSANTTTVSAASGVGTTITNTGGDSIVTSGGTSDLNFTGRINQNAPGSTASIFSAENGHDGDVTMVELTANAGVINATTGDGLQFDAANGTYLFTDRVILTSTSAAVNVQGGSAQITIADGEFTNTTGDTITFDGGTAGLDFTGRISQTLNDALVLNVTDHGAGGVGTLRFRELTAGAGVINATTGDGLLFNNDDGTYNFDDAVVLNSTATSGSAHIEVINGSSGNFAFTDAANVITNPDNLEDALVIQNSSANFTYEGAITTDATSGRPVLISGNTGGSITIAATVNSTEDGILLDNNTGAILFNDQVTLSTNDEAAVTVQNNTAGSVQFNNIDINTSTGDGFVGLNNTGTSTLTVLAGNGNNITTTTGTGLDLDNVIVGTSGITFASINSNGADNAIELDNVTGGPVTVNGGTVSATAAAVSIVNAENVSINNMIITAAGGAGVDYQVTAGTSRLSLNNMAIGGTTGDGISLLVNNTATLANITVDNSTVTNSNGEQAISLNTAGSLKTVNLLVEDSTFNGNSAGNPTADFQVAGTTNLNATVLQNTFNNPGGRPFEMAVNSASSSIRLSLFDNNASGALANEYFLEQNAGTFTVEDLTAPPAPVGQTAEDRNGGEIDITGTITNDLGNIPTPSTPD